MRSIMTEGEAASNPPALMPAKRVERQAQQVSKRDGMKAGNKDSGQCDPEERRDDLKDTGAVMPLRRSVARSA